MKHHNRMIGLRTRDNLQCGFTLLELSIVLVIIGLIIGGVSVGRDLIRQSQLKSVITDEQKYETAIKSFQSTYSALPGDIKNATDFWGTNPHCDTGGAGTGTQTCNGNGDEMINNPSPNQYGESFGLWQHLANAGLIPGKFTGAYSGAFVIGVNVPTNRLGTVWWPYYWDIQSFFQVGFDNPPNQAGNSTDILAFGYTAQSPLTAAEAYSIDVNIDDGNPGTGKVLARTAASGCATSNDLNTAKYAVTTTGYICGLGFEF